MPSFAELKKTRSQSTEKLVEALENMSKNRGDSRDSRFWNVTKDKAGNGFAVIRFMPSPDEDGIPHVEFFEHSFKGPTDQWYIERSLTSIKQKDPVGQYNQAAWKAGDEEGCKHRKRKLTYVSNIYIIDDPANPENNGKVFLFKYGKQIHDMIMLRLKPTNPYQKKLDPFNMWEGANFILEVRKEGQYPNYLSSSWADPGPLFDNDDEIEAVYNQLHSLAAIADVSNYKTYDQLKARFDLVMGFNQNGNSAESFSPSAEARPLREAQPSQFSSKAVMDEDDDEDEDLSMFRRKLKEEDDDDIPF